MLPASSAVACRSCGARTVDQILEFGSQPDPDWLLDPWDPTPAPEAPVELAICAVCGLVQLLGPRPAGPTPPHGHAMTLPEGDPWVGLIELSLSTAPRLVLDIDGSSGLPAQLFAAAGRVVTAPADDWSGAADLILVGHALAHQDDLGGLVGRMEAVLAPKGVIAIDFHHVLGLAQGQFDVVSHTHRSYLSLHSVDQLLDRHGLVVVAAQRIAEYGGTVRVLAARRVDDVATHQDGSVVEGIRREELTARVDRRSGYEGLRQQMDSACSGLLAFLADAAHAGRTVAGYGAASRGTALLNIAGVGVEQLPFVVDRAPAKQGRQLPRARIPVLSPTEIESRKPEHILILPWPMAGQISDQLAYVRAWGAGCVVALPQLEIVQ